MSAPFNREKLTAHAPQTEVGEELGAEISRTIQSENVCLAQFIPTTEIEWAVEGEPVLFREVKYGKQGQLKPVVGPRRVQAALTTEIQGSQQVQMGENGGEPVIMDVPPSAIQMLTYCGFQADFETGSPGEETTFILNETCSLGDATQGEAGCATLVTAERCGAVRAAIDVTGNATFTFEAGAVATASYEFHGVDPGDRIFATTPDYLVGAMGAPASPGDVQYASYFDVSGEPVELLHNAVAGESGAVEPLNWSLPFVSKGLEIVIERGGFELETIDTVQSFELNLNMSVEEQPDIRKRLGYSAATPRLLELPELNVTLTADELAYRQLWAAFHNNDGDNISVSLKAVGPDDTVIEFTMPNCKVLAPEPTEVNERKGYDLTIHPYASPENGGFDDAEKNIIQVKWANSSR